MPNSTVQTFNHLKIHTQYSICEGAIKIDDLKLREETNAQRLERRASLRESINKGLPALEEATSKYALDDYYGKALSLVISGNARKAFELAQEIENICHQYINALRIGIPKILSKKEMKIVLGKFKNYKKG